MRWPEKHAARCAVRDAVKFGALHRPSVCEDCGEVAKVQAHHSDYLRPLDVRWLCISCHIVVDKAEGRRYRGIPSPSTGVQIDAAIRTALLNLRKLSALSGISLSYLKLLSAGRRGASPKTRVALARAFRAHAAQLFRAAADLVPEDKEHARELLAEADALENGGGS